jgi:hypothetical protein
VGFRQDYYGNTNIFIMNEKSARKKLEKAKRKRNQRRTPYPFGFEYNKERK